MKDKLQLSTELFIYNTQMIKKDFFWQNTSMKRLVALLYAAEGKSANVDAVRECHELIKQNTGIFSAFRGNTALLTAAMLSLSTDKDRIMADTLSVYNIMKVSKFWSSDYLAVAAYQIAVNSPRDRFGETVERAKAFYDGMKSRHWFYTGQDDYIFAAMLGLSNVDVASGIECMERFYTALKPEFSYGNSIQALAQVLVLCNETEEAINRVLALREAFRDRNIRLDRLYTLSSLGVLAMFLNDAASIADAVLDVYNFLRGQRGFGSWSVSKQELLLLSVSLVAYVDVDEVKNGVLTSALTTSITNIIIAQQTAMIAATAGAVAASSSSK